MFAFAFLSVVLQDSLLSWTQIHVIICAVDMCGHLLVSTVDGSAMVAYESYMDLLTHKSCTDFQVMVFMSHHIILS